LNAPTGVRAALAMTMSVIGGSPRWGDVDQKQVVANLEVRWVRVHLASFSAIGEPSW